MQYILGTIIIAWVSIAIASYIKKRSKGEVER